jgi:hypothetical protein
MTATIDPQITRTTLAFPLSLRGSVKDEARPVGVIMSVDCIDFIMSPTGSSELDVVPVSQHASFPMKTPEVKRQGRPVTAKVQVPEFCKPQVDHHLAHFFDRYSERKVKLPIVLRHPALIDKVIEGSVEPYRDFFKDSFHLFVTGRMHTRLTAKRGVLGSERILEFSSLLNQARQLFTLHANVFLELTTSIQA